MDRVHFAEYIGKMEKKLHLFVDLIGDKVLTPIFGEDVYLE